MTVQPVLPASTGKPVGLFYSMTREYEEYKANKDKRKTTDILLKILGVIVVVGCVAVGLFFLLMVAFPRGLWLELFAQ